MKKVYYLPNCDTSKRVLKAAGIGDDFQLQNIKTDPITPEQIDHMAKLSGSYEALFSRRARLYKERNLKEQTLEENDYRNLILEHYTFLIRPTIIIGNEIFIGGQKKVLDKLKSSL